MTKLLRLHLFLHNTLGTSSVEINPISVADLPSTSAIWMWARDEHWFSCPGWDGIPHELQDDADFWLYVANRGFQLEFIGFKEECLRKTK